MSDIDLLENTVLQLGVINGVNDVKNKKLTLDIVCKFCGDVRATVTIKYKTMKDQGYFRATCICEKCLKEFEDDRKKKRIGV